MKLEEVLECVRDELSEIIPDIIDECLFTTKNEASKEHLQLEICKIIESCCEANFDIKAIFSWLEIDDSFFDQAPFNQPGCSLMEYKRSFREMGGGVLIIDKIIENLLDISIELAHAGQEPIEV